MSSACIALDLINDERLNTLTYKERCAVWSIVGLLARNGDGTFTDDQLRRSVHMGRPKWALFVEPLVLWKFLRRSPENGNLCRGAVLNPDTVRKSDTRHAKNGSGVDSAAVLDLRAELVEERRQNHEFRQIIRHAFPHLGLAEEPIETPQIDRTNAGQTPDKTPQKHVENTSNRTFSNGNLPEDSRERAEESLLSSSSLSPDSLSLPLDARKHAEDAGCGEIYDLLHENDIPDLRILEALAISWKQKGRRTINAGPYVLAIAQNLEADAECTVEDQKALDILVTAAGGLKDTGATAKPRAAPNRRAKGTTLTDAAKSSYADLEEKYANGDLICQSSIKR